MIGMDISQETNILVCDPLNKSLTKILYILLFSISYPYNG